MSTTAPVLRRAAVAAPRRKGVSVAEPRHLRVVEAADRRRLRLTPLTMVLVGAVVVAGMLAVAVTQTMLVQGQLRIDELDARVDAEQARYQRLRLRVAELESPERIVQVAIDRLGMVPPDEVVYLTPERPVREDGAAAGDIAAGAEERTGDESTDTSWQDVKPYLETTP